MSKDLYNSKENKKRMDEYRIETSTAKIEKRLKDFIQKYPAIKSKLRRLQQNPRKAIDAHILHGEFEGLWSCHLSRNPDLVLIYFIDNNKKIIGLLRIGSHGQVY